MIVCVYCRKVMEGISESRDGIEYKVHAECQEKHRREKQEEIVEKLNAQWEEKKSAS